MMSASVVSCPSSPVGMSTPRASWRPISASRRLGGRSQLCADGCIGSQGMALPLLLDGLQVRDECLEMAVGDGLAEPIMPHNLPKPFAPDRHVPTAMGWDDGPPVNHSSNFGHGEMPPAPLRNTCEICRERLER